MTALPSTIRTAGRAGLVAAAVAVGAASGLAAAAIPGADGTIQACIDAHDTEPIPPKKPSARVGDGSVRIVETPADCEATETPLSWHQGGEPARPRAQLIAAHEDDVVDLPDNGAWVVVVHNVVPAGSWSILGRTNLEVVPEPDFDVDCRLRRDDEILDVAPVGATGAATRLEVPVSLLGVVTTAESADVVLECRAEDVVNALISGSRILVTEVALLEDQG